VPLARRVKQISRATLLLIIFVIFHITSLRVVKSSFLAKDRENTYLG